MKEKEMYEKYKKKQVILTKRTEGKNYYYHGKIIEVYDDKICFDDRKKGEVILDFGMIKAIEPNNRR